MDAAAGKVARRSLTNVWLDRGKSTVPNEEVQRPLFLYLQEWITAKSRRQTTRVITANDRGKKSMPVATKAQDGVEDIFPVFNWKMEEGKAGGFGVVESAEANLGVEPATNSLGSSRYPQCSQKGMRVITSWLHESRVV